MPRLATNKLATANYTILETVEAGVVLSGAEVKSAKAGQVNLRGSYVSIDATGTVWLKGAHIAAYRPAGNKTAYQADKDRRLLLHKKQIDSLRGKSQQVGLTILPLSVYTKGSLVKLELAIARGKRQFDKRASIKKRELSREIHRALRQK